MKKIATSLVSHRRYWAAYLLVSLSLMVFLSFPADAYDKAKNCWVADHAGNRVVKLSADGSVICEFSDSNHPGMIGPVTLAVNPADGSCWVACTSENTVFKLSSQCGLVLRPKSSERFYGNSFSA